MNKSIFRALGVLAQNKGMNQYLNIFKETGEGIKSRGMDFFNKAIKQVVDEGDQIETTLTTKKYVHPDRPDIFVEVDVSTGNANVGLVDPDAGAFAYTDEMKKDQLISSLEDEGFGAMGARARADEILTMREKAKIMKEMGKSKVKNKRQKMIDLYNQIIRDRNKQANGGRIDLRFGGDTMGGPNDKSAQSNRERARSEQYSRSSTTKKGSDQGHSRFKVGSGYYGEKKTSKTQKDGNGNGGQPPSTPPKNDRRNKTPFIQLQPYDPAFSSALGLNALIGRRGLLTALIDPVQSVEEDQLVGDLSFTGGMGPIGIDIGTDFAGNKNLDIRGGTPAFGGMLTGGLSTDLEGDTGFNIGFRKEFEDGGRVSLTVIEIPDISGSGVETLFKKR